MARLQKRAMSTTTASVCRHFLVALRATLSALWILGFVVPLSTTGQTSAQGQWQTLPYEMPINPVHAALLHNGKVLIVSGSGSLPSNLSYAAAIWDPQAGTITTQLLGWDMFCNGMIVLPDGRPLILGGTIEYDPFHGDWRTSAYDPATGNFVDLQPMAHGRWYPTGTVLGNGSVMVFSGLGDVGPTNQAVEIYTLGSGWSPEYQAPFTPPLYPRMHLLPNGTVFDSGSSIGSNIFNPLTQTWTMNVATTNYAFARTYGSSVLLPLTPANGYDPRILILGGGSPATATTELIDLAAPNPQWVWGPSMSEPRIEMNATILPNGKVLATGGSLNDEDATTASLNADLFDPTTNTFSSAGTNVFPRLYHSVALLLPDATVLIAGSNPQRGVYEPHMEIYSPAYLFNPDGSLATRPTITGTPGVIGYSGSFQVTTPNAAAISSVVLMRDGAVTHAFNMDQRMVGLSFSVQGNTLNVTGPPSGNIAPPGYYMLFIVNSAGVPSLASFVQVSTAPTDQPPKGTIISPPSNVTLTSTGQSVSFSGTGSDSNGTIASYSWVFPGGTPSSSTLANPGNVVYSTPGTYVASLTVTDNSGLTDPSPPTVTISVAPTFSLSATPTTQAAALGQSATYTVNVAAGTGFAGTVNLGVNGLPAGVTPTFSPASVARAGSSTLTLTTSSTTPVGIYPVTITGTFGTSTQTTGITLAVGIVTTPTISPAAGTYLNSVSVSLSEATPGATVYYTTDGSTPNATPSEQYSAPFTLTSSATVNAIAALNGLTNSAIASVKYVVQPPAATPTFSPSGGTISLSQQITLLDATPGAKIYYTTNGNTPTVTLSELYSGPFTLSGPANVKAIAAAPGFANSAVGSASYSIQGGAATCPCTIWSSSAVPSVADSKDTQPVEVGVNFTADTNGYITGIRFYKGSANTGTHIGDLWSSSGALLATATFTSETTSGWQQVNFSTPVAITANTVYVASYHSSGDFAVDRNYFATSGVDNSPLHALANGVNGASNGVFAYSQTTAFPSSSYQSSNYWVDVVYVPTGGPLTIVNTSLPNGVQFAQYNQTLTAIGGTSPYTWTVTSGNLPAGLALSSTGQITGTSTASGTVTFTVQATDSSNPAQTATQQLSITLAAPATCPCTIWPNNATPSTPDSHETQSVELGVKFTSDANGYITGIRFYKGTNNTGTHIGNLWSSTGTLLATGTFTSETASGWQQVNFSNPVAITANTVYVASYHSSSGDFGVNRNYFATSGTDNSPLHALANNAPGGPDGVLAYGAGSTFPTSTYQSSNYWVDVVFNTTLPPLFLSVSPASVTGGASSTGTVTLNGVPAEGVVVPVSSGNVVVAVPSSVSVSGSNMATFAVTTSPVSTTTAVTLSATYSGVTQNAILTVTPPVPSAVILNPATVIGGNGSTGTVTLNGPTPSAGTVITLSSSNPETVTVPSRVTVTSGNSVNFSTTTTAVTASTSVTITASSNGGSQFAVLTVNPASAPPPNCPCTIWPSTTAPSQADTNQNQAVELGVNFMPTSNGYITGIRFYKGPNNTSTHIGNLWSGSGTLLASATFTSETASGWQQVNFASPVTVTANTVYTASYHSSGDFAVDRNYFATSAVFNGPLQALASGTGGVLNGVFAYGAASTFPSSSYQASNYWVDVVYVPSGIPLTVTTTLLPNGSQFSVYNQSLTAEGGTAPYSWSVTSGSLPAGLTLSTSGQLTGTPTVSGTVNFTVQVTDSSNPVQTVTQGLSITLAAPAPCPCTIWPATATPSLPDTNETQPLEIGVKFTSDVNGYIHGIRFYKGPNNTGTHIGNLWTSTGVLLASATFTSETASGWQQVNFSTPVAITANTVYVASYHSNGDFSVNRNYFSASGVDNAPLHALSTGASGGPNGVFTYGVTSALPSGSYAASNYWIDVVFNTQ